jgi:hypothetical protein
MFKRIFQTYLSSSLDANLWGSCLPKMRAVMEKFQNGEIHVILPESKSDETWETADNINETEIRKIMKQEASKPLLLLRAE